MMLTRVLEPEAMDTPEEALAYDAMDHAEVNRQFVDDLLSAGLVDAPKIEVLDLGTGTAQIPIELCRRCPQLRVVAVDLADHMLRIAQENVARAGLADRITLERADAKTKTLFAGRFAAVISNSLIHHVPEPGGLLVEAVRAAAPGALLFFRDLLRPPDDAAVKRLVYQHARQATPHQQQLFDDSLRAALSLEEIRQLVLALHFDRLGVRTTSDRHWTWTARKPNRA
ncbi:MAG: class I SAM-dependent methyltransferase [Planctomycetes bacterium]|nr:class I SAM-dependent methyltransferase [Planctomycetota bacterium]